MCFSTSRVRVSVLTKLQGHLCELLASR
jgi:hypothetical protein